jgi:hypothetical protein
MKTKSHQAVGNAGLKGAQLVGDQCVRYSSNVRRIDDLFGIAAKDHPQASKDRSREAQPNGERREKPVRRK